MIPLVTVTFEQTGRPFWTNFARIDLIQGHITKEEFDIRTARDQPKPYQPFDAKCGLIVQNAGYFDVMTLHPIFLSNGNGLTIPWSFYRLSETGEVSYFYKEANERSEEKMIDLILKGKINPSEWSWNVPKWSIDARNVLLPIIRLLFLANRYDKNSAFGSIPRDVTKLIAQTVFNMRRDPVWILPRKNIPTNKKRRV